MTSSTIVWRVQPDEHLRAIRILKQQHHRQTRRIWRELRVIAALALLAIIFALATRQWRAQGRIRPAEALWVVVPALALAAFAATRPLALKRAVRAQLRHNPATQQERRYTLDENGLSIAGETFLVTLSWEQLETVRETPEFLLFFARKTAYYLPKRAIMWPNRLDDLRDLLRQSMGVRAAVR